MSSNPVATTKPERVYLSPPHMTGNERELLLEALDSNWIAPLGPHVDAFEREFAAHVGRRHAVALSSGTAALHLALLLRGVESGDEVVTASLTFAATANAVCYVGATPVFLDSDESSWNLDPNLLETELARADKHGRRPKAVLVVDVFGQCADFAPIVELCQRYEIPLIEDAAEGLGARYRGQPAGAFGDIAGFSFNGNKIITTSGGGMLVTDNAEWASRARFLATQARDPAPHYEHSVVGYNYRLSNLLAAVGRAQLQALDLRVDQRRANYDYYLATLGDLPGLAFMPELADSRSTRWLTCVTIDPERSGVSREDVRLALDAQNIESRPLWKPMHLQKLYSGCRMTGGQVSERLFEHGLCLPSGSSLSDNDRQRVVTIVRDVFRTAESRRQPADVASSRAN